MGGDSIEIEASELNLRVEFMVPGAGVIPTNFMHVMPRRVCRYGKPGLVSRKEPDHKIDN